MDLFQDFLSCFSSVQSLSNVRLFVTPWTAAHQASCPSPTLGVHPNPCPLSRWCHPTTSSSVSLFSPCPQSFPASGAFPIGFSHQVARYWSFNFSISPSNEYSGMISFRITGLTSLLPKGLSRVFSSTTVQKHQFFSTQPSLWSNSHLYTTTGKATAFTMWTFAGKVMFLLLNTLSRSVIVFLPRGKCLLISWLQSLSAVILEANKIKSVSVYTLPPFIYLSLYKQTSICGL